MTVFDATRRCSGSVTSCVMYVGQPRVAGSATVNGAPPFTVTAIFAGNGVE